MAKFLWDYLPLWAHHLLEFLTDIVVLEQYTDFGQPTPTKTYIFTTRTNWEKGKK